MSLDFDVTGIKDYERVTTDPLDRSKWHPITEHLVFAAMSVGMGEITENNYREFYTRLRISDMVYGPGLSVNGVMQSVRIEDVKMHIGLRTNVSPLSDARFRERVFRMAASKVERMAGSKEGCVSLHEEYEAACKAGTL